MEITGRWKNDAIKFWENGVVLILEIRAVLELFQDCNFGLSKAGPQLIGATCHWFFQLSGVGPSNMSPKPYSVCTCYLGLPSTCAIGPIIRARGDAVIGAYHWASPVIGRQAQSVLAQA